MVIIRIFKFEPRFEAHIYSYNSLREYGLRTQDYSLKKLTISEWKTLQDLGLELWQLASYFWTNIGTGMRANSEMLYGKS